MKNVEMKNKGKNRGFFFLAVQMFVMLIIATTFVGCDEDDDIDEFGGGVTNELTTSSTVSTDGSGLVEFTASATNASLYQLFPGQLEDTVISRDGNFSYTYTESGTYTAKIVAEIVASNPLTEEIEVTITVDSEPVFEGNPVPTEGYTSAETYDGMTLVWSDEFNGTALNTTDWNYELGTTDPFGNNGWGNAELQSYTQESVSVGDGYLTITASSSGSSYTSGRINTRDNQEFQYGRVDIRAALPNQKGMWPALWMLGENHLEDGWPECGEIDIMELFAGPETSDEIKSNAFWGTSIPAANAPSPPYELDEGDFSDEWHVFSLNWTANTLQYFVDDNMHYELTINDELAAHFRNEFFFIFNIAVGGNAVENPDATTMLPQHMYVDYVRIFQSDGSQPTSITEFNVDLEGDNPTWETFGGNSATVIANPDASGINTSANVLEVIHGNETWGGQFFDLSGPLDLTSSNEISVKVWAPGDGFNFRLKLENIADAEDFHEYDLAIPSGEEWVELTFDLTDDLNGAAAGSDTYARIVLFPGWDVANAGTFYLDDIVFGDTGSGGSGVSDVNVDLEGDNPTWETFGGNSATVVANPDASGINTSANVLEVIHGNETWGGQFFDLSGPLDFSTKTRFSIKVWAPGTGFNFRLKLENTADAEDFHEYDLAISSGEEWVELVFDTTNDNNGMAAGSGTYARIVLFPGWDVANAGTFYLDDIQLIE